MTLSPTPGSPRLRWRPDSMSRPWPTLPRPRCLAFRPASPWAAQPDCAERRVIQAIREDIFTPEAIGYITRCVNDALRIQARQRSSPRQQEREQELHHALLELENIKQFVAVYSLT